MMIAGRQIEPSPSGASLQSADRAEALRAAQATVLEVAVQGTLAKALEALAHMVEDLSVSRVMVSILLLDEDGLHLRHGAGPSLAPEYNAAIDGIAIGPSVGSCGTAVIRREPVFVADIANDPLWTDFRELALAHGLRSCWSIPIIGGDGVVLGTFAMYHREPREPIPADLELVDFVTRTAVLVIERKRVEERLRRSEEQLRLATEAAEVGLWDLDPLSDVLFWPPRVKAMFGISPDRPISMTDFYAGLHPEDARATGEAFAAAIDPDRRAVYDVEYRTVGKEDGVVRWVAAKGRAVFDETGRCTRVLGTAIDITSRKQTELVLKDLNETLEAKVVERTAALLLHENIVRSHRSPVCAFDHDYRLIAFNQAHSDEFFRIFAYRVQLGDVFPDLFPPEQATIMRGFMARALAGETYVVEEAFGNPDLAKPVWEVAYYPMYDEAGRIFGAFHHANDISNRLRAEAELEATHEALRQAQKMEAVGQLTGGLAHDFNNLLTGMMGNLELLQLRVARGRLDDLDRFINAAQGAGRRAASLTQRLLAFSRRQTLDPKPTDVNRLIAGLEEMLQRTVGSTAHIEIVGAAGLWPAYIDGAQLENAILNLCINGRDAIPEGGKLTIETANKWMDDRTARERDLTPGQYISICVTDTGTGMSPATIARAFEPFYTTKPIGQGTGLGLSMIYGFAKQSGGQVRIYSELGQGTTVCVYLPRHHGDAEEAIEGDSGEISQSHSAHTVLVVDDEATIRHLIDEVLDDLGYTVIGAADGAAGIKVLQSGARIELLITDVGLPNGMNGRQVADAARILRPGLKVLFITGFAENAAVGNGHLEPGMELLTKPFTLGALSKKVAEMLTIR